MLTPFGLIILSVFFGSVLSDKEVIVESPFYLRARIHDSHTASVLFEIDRQAQYRVCTMYKFTIRRNKEHPYSMPEQNLTFWRNSLEMKHLPAGRYRVCAIICSENFGVHSLIFSQGRNDSSSIIACVFFDVHRSHLLVLTLYILVFVFLIICQITYSLQKRKFKARLKEALIEVENSLLKWRQTQNSSTTEPSTTSYVTLQNIIHHPASPVEYSVLNPNNNPSIMFQLGPMHDDPLANENIK